MKAGTLSLLALSLATSLTTLSGCALSAPVLVGAVGPAGPVTSHEPQGKLVVYSATTVYTTEQSRYALHTSYTLYDDKGVQLQTVKNRAGLFAAQPVTLTLAAGHYRVRALTSTSGPVVVPVVVAPGRTTTVYLDDTRIPTDLQASTDEVKLPDGRVVGWRAP
ncbi:MAG TPA: hypothetical protein VHW25_18770 [Steroidobacteraceae bacterium]|nr:hypothetical protein [Steroidobacteraceae bacterium]